MRLVITGGHHSSALPVIEEIKSRVPDAELCWFGHKYSVRGDTNTTMEYRDITALGIPFYSLSAGKVYKIYNPFRLFKVLIGIIHAFYLLLKIRPDKIISFGGYLAAPVVFAGWVLGIKSVTHEQTVTAGYANKFIAHFVKKILISWPESAEYFPADKTFLTGIPLRKEIFKRTTDMYKINENLPTVYFTAGKTGSHIINTAVENSLDKMLTACNVIHQCGDVSLYNDYQRLHEKFIENRESVLDGSLGIYNLRKFITGEEIGEVFYRADLVVGRAGAHTVAEMLALEKPCILIPIPWVSHNEQNENAKILQKAGLAEIMPEEELSSERLMDAVSASLAKLSKYKLKDVELKKLVMKNSAKLIVDEIQNL